EKLGAWEDPGVVDENGRRPKLPRDGAHHRVRVARPRDVARDEPRAAARPTDLGRDLHGGVALAEVVEADVGALARARARDGAARGGEGNGDGAADALLGPGDERARADQTHEPSRFASDPARRPSVQYPKAHRPRSRDAQPRVAGTRTSRYPTRDRAESPARGW